MKLFISEIMKSKKISIELLKNKIENNGGSLSRTSISNIINNKSYPKVDTLYLIAKALEVDVKDLFSNDLSKNPIHLIIKGELHTFDSKEELKKYVGNL